MGVCALRLGREVIGRRQKIVHCYVCNWGTPSLQICSIKALSWWLNANVNDKGRSDGADCHFSVIWTWALQPAPSMSGVTNTRCAARSGYCAVTLMKTLRVRCQSVILTMESIQEWVSQSLHCAHCVQTFSCQHALPTWTFTRRQIPTARQLQGCDRISISTLDWNSLISELNDRTGEHKAWRFLVPAMEDPAVMRFQKVYKHISEKQGGLRSENKAEESRLGVWLRFFSEPQTGLRDYAALLRVLFPCYLTRWSKEVILSSNEGTSLQYTR